MELMLTIWPGAPSSSMRGTKDLMPLMVPSRLTPRTQAQSLGVAVQRVRSSRRRRCCTGGGRHRRCPRRRRRARRPEMRRRRQWARPAPDVRRCAARRWPVPAVDGRCLPAPLPCRLGRVGARLQARCRWRLRSRRPCVPQGDPSVRSGPAGYIRSRGGSVLGFVGAGMRQQPGGHLLRVLEPHAVAGVSNHVHGDVGQQHLGPVADRCRVVEP